MRAVPRCAASDGWSLGRPAAPRGSSTQICFVYGIGASGRRFGAPYSRLFCSRTASSSANFGRTATGNIHWACWRLQYCFASDWPMYMAAGHAPLSALKTRLRSPTTIRSGLGATPSVPKPMQAETLATSQRHSLFKRKRKCELSGPKNAHLLRCAVPADPGWEGKDPYRGPLMGHTSISALLLAFELVGCSCSRIVVPGGIVRALRDSALW